MTGNIGIPLAAGGTAHGLPAADGTAAAPLAVLGLFLAWHGYLVYTGRVKVAPFRGYGLSRPDLDLSALWCGAGLVLWGVGWVLSIPPLEPIDIFGQIVAWIGAAVFLFGIASYIYLPKRLRPRWARTDSADSYRPAPEPVAAANQAADEPEADQAENPAS